MLYTSVRTQIYLPRELREKIDRARSLTGESLAEYLRRAARERVEKEKKKRTDLKKLADEVVGSVKKSAWYKQNAVKWQRKLRAEEDQHWLKRWNEAKKQVSSGRIKKNVSA